MATTPTKFTNLGVGSAAIAAGVVSVAAVGSLFLGGDIHTDSTLNSAPSLQYNSGSFLTYQEQMLTSSGTTNLTTHVALPSNYASGGVLHSYALECNRKPLLTSGSVAVGSFNKQAITAGTVLKNFVFLGTGTTTFVQSGANTLIPDNGFISFISNISSPSLNLNGDCMMKVWTHEKYGRSP